MLKKKKYAKWGNDDEGLYEYVADKSFFLDMSNLNPYLFYLFELKAYNLISKLNAVNEQGLTGAT